LSTAGRWRWLALIANLQMAFTVSPPDKHRHAVMIWAFEHVEGACLWSACWWHSSRSVKWLEGVCGLLDEFTYQVACSCTKKAEERVNGGTIDEVVIERALEISQKVRECTE
jgi:hypothetical protein